MFLTGSTSYHPCIMLTISSGSLISWPLQNFFDCSWGLFFFDRVEWGVVQFASFGFVKILYPDLFCFFFYFRLHAKISLQIVVYFLWYSRFEILVRLASFVSLLLLSIRLRSWVIFLMTSFRKCRSVHPVSRLWAVILLSIGWRDRSVSFISSVYGSGLTLIKMTSERYW